MVNQALRNRGPKHFVYRYRPADPGMLRRTPTQEEQDALSRHYEYVRQLSIQGTCVLAGRTASNDDETFGIVVLETDSEEKARAIMVSDPAVRRGVMTAELFPFRLAVERKTRNEGT
jgi:uncharacterized protein YciI